MIEKLKICTVGATGVGKTSLVSRFARSAFETDYRTTIGVGIERRDIQRSGRTAQLVIWDLSGEDEFQNVQPAYFRGAAGYVLVIDGTRRETVDTAIELHARVSSVLGKVPFVAAINKVDLVETWELLPRHLDPLEQRGWELVRTSAKTGAEVDELFGRLVDAIHRTRDRPWI